ncbi:MAG: AMP-binding protein [Acidimicrobiia bacterium]|nr:AMP-binding protein [Acidimicrobiia bacterium]
MLKRYLDIVSGAARRTPDATAVVGSDTRLTFRELDERVGRLGAALRGAGLAPGDRVALLAANELEYVEVQAACARSGFTLVPLNFRLAGPELDYIVGDCAPAVIVGGRGEHERITALGRERGCRLVGLGPTDPSGDVEPYDAFLASAQPDPDADPLDLDLNTTFLYTSGTTGRPKGAMIDRAGLTARVFVNALEMEARADDRFLHSLPMFHIGAFLTYAIVFRGGATVMLHSFTPEGWFETLQHERCTATVLVPTMIQMLLESPASATHDSSSLRLIVYGGSSIEPPLLRRALERFRCGFHQQYGMTETGAQTILHPEDHDPDDDEALASGGRAAVSFDVEVFDEHDRPVPQGEVGEIVCRGPAVMSGYWNLPEATAETLRHGWMHTGDLGRFDPRGFLHVVDRRNDMIVTGGENVYPREVEAVLTEHPGVRDATVIGLPDPKWGQVVTGVLAGEAPPDDELDAYLRERLASYKVPKRWVRVGELPRNVTGKVLKVELRKELADPS